MCNFTVNIAIFFLLADGFRQLQRVTFGPFSTQRVQLLP